VLKPDGYMIITSPDAPAVERDSFQCNHCQTVVFVEPLSAPADAGGFCRRCMGLICGPCADAGNCVPWEKALEAMEKRSESRRRMDAALAGA
jgi:hypothetical protein